MPSKNQSMQTFAQQLCSGIHENGKDTVDRNEKKLQSRQPLWVTVTREYTQWQYILYIYIM